MENGKIYKLVNDLNDKIYIGCSNYAYLSTRMNSHRQSCKDTSGRRNSKLYNYMREVGVDHFKIEVIETYRCETKKELCEREQYWIEKLKPELNMFRAIADPDYEKTKRDPEKRKEQKKQYYDKNKEKILESQRIPFVCECGCSIQKAEKARHQRSKKHIELMDSRA